MVVALFGAAVTALLPKLRVAIRIAVARPIRRRVARMMASLSIRA
jgi:hypothetical protein